MITEERGVMTIGDVMIDGIADRIDVNPDGSAAIIDYKTGGQFSKKALQEGRYPQLPIEALMIEADGFEKLKSAKSKVLSYIVLTGGHEPGHVVSIDVRDHDVLKTTHDGLTQLINVFMDDDTPYICQPNPSHILRFNDYEHLERVGEWGTAGNEDDGS